MSTPAFWQSCLESFQRELTPQQFNTWIRPLRLEPGDGGLRLVAPNRFVLQWVKERYAGRIEELAAGTGGQPLRLVFAVADAAERPNTVVSAPKAPDPVPAAARRGEQAALNPGFFASFVSGKADQFARRGMQIAEHRLPTTPFVCTAALARKTHLIQAIGNHPGEKPDARSVYIHAKPMSRTSCGHISTRHST
jgi:chromosomal replication initiator protein